MPNKNVAYIYSDMLIQWCSSLPKVKNRAKLVHSLIESYGLLGKLQVICSGSCSYDDLRAFHSSEYIEHIQHQNMLVRLDDTDADEFGTGYDCPPFPGMFDCGTWLCGATLRAAEVLSSGEARIALNWCGGWHHAKRNAASGFCYFNDIVLGILKLRQRFSKVLYVDFDLHHGDGVEEAFAFTSTVFTVSFHKHGPGFFPGTGHVGDKGFGRGKGYCVNVPLKDGIGDDAYVHLVKQVLDAVRRKYPADVLVCQFGADGLCTDDHRSFNLTSAALCRCLRYLIQWNLPLMILGGGGYNFVDTAKCWAELTAVAVGEQLPRDIPDHRYFLKYGPDFSIDISPSCRVDENKPEFLDSIFQRILSNLQYIPKEPSKQPQPPQQQVAKNAKRTFDEMNRPCQK